MTISPIHEIQPPGQSTPETYELQETRKSSKPSFRDVTKRFINGGASPPSPPLTPTDEEKDVFPEASSPPETAQPVVERWNYPRSNITRLGFSFFSFIVTGMNDGAVGVRLNNHSHVAFLTDYCQ
jgi:hypothetical protein